MNIKDRIKRLCEVLERDKRSKVVLSYGDGSRRELTWMDALTEIFSGADVVHVQYPDKTGCSLLAAMLPGTENLEFWAELEEVD